MLFIAMLPWAMPGVVLPKEGLEGLGLFLDLCPWAAGGGVASGRKGWWEGGG